MDRSDQAIVGPMLAAGRTSEVYAWGEDRVLKLLRPGFPDALATAEAVAADLTTRAGLEVPEFHGTTWVDGRRGLVYERLVGPSLLDALAARPWTVSRVASDFGRLHAGMHRLLASGLPDWREQLVATLDRVDRRDLRDAALRRAEALPGGSAVLHGDMHPGNVILTADGPRIIDWLTASVGPATADVARTLLLVRDSGLPPDMPPARRALIVLLRRAFARAYLAAYRRARVIDLVEVRAWRLPILVARLEEDVVGERDHVLRVIARELRR